MTNERVSDEEYGRMEREWAALTGRLAEAASDRIHDAVLAAYPDATGYEMGADEDDGTLYPFLVQVLTPAGVVTSDNGSNDAFVDLADDVADPMQWLIANSPGAGWQNGTTIEWDA